MNHLGFNYRITDFQCALGISQLASCLDGLPVDGRSPHGTMPPLPILHGFKRYRFGRNARTAYHLYVVQIDAGASPVTRGALFQLLRRAGIGANVHYIPVHLHPYYRSIWARGPANVRRQKPAYERILSLPLHPGMTDAEQERVIDCLRGVMQ